MREPLHSEKAYQKCDLSIFSFATTAELDATQENIGQERAIEALEFSARINRDGYNLFAMGPSGSGKFSTVMAHLKSKAKEEAIPKDWCYVNNFADSRKPIAIDMPPGFGKRFKSDLSELVLLLRSALPAVYDSNEYRNARELINQKYIQLQEKVFTYLQEEAAKRNISMQNNYAGRVTFAPIINGKALSNEEFSALDNEAKEKINDNMTAFEATVKDALRQVGRLNKEMQQEFKELDHMTTADTVDAHIDELRTRYAGIPKIIAYFDALEKDIIINAKDFLVKPDESGIVSLMSVYSTPSFRRYEVNLFIDNEESDAAPVIYEDNPNYLNLIGRIEHASQIGTLVTDFSMIKSGALHKANGGYLVVDVRKVLMQPFAWEELKRVMRSKELRIESLAQQYSLISTVTLEPEAIPADIKIVLIGERILYYLLHQYDPDFKELFKVVADFEDDLPRTAENMLLYAEVIGTIAKKHDILPLTREAVARIIEQSARESEDAGKLSTHLRTLSDLLKEADYHAKEAKNTQIDVADIQAALDAQVYRSSRIQTRIYDQIDEGTLLINVQGEAIGQINGLSVVTLGGYRFGIPSRITARTRLGKGEIVNIERSVELSGPIHSKGVMILSSYLGARYTEGFPFTLAASLVFEQSYGMIDGDSASSAELYALLSSLSGIPIKQNLAVTGSVNQFGDVQAIGGVNEKIEGFFDVCMRIDPEGVHGVLIPDANVKHLMLKKSVVEAMEAGKFLIYPVKTIDEGISILTGVDAGAEDAAGAFDAKSLNGRVVQRLREFATLLQQFNRKQAPAGSKETAAVETND